MKKIALIISCVFLTTVAFQSCKKSDQNLNSDVMKVLEERYSTVSASTSKGVVTLTGIVDSEQQKTEAASQARSVKDVKEVVNHIEVRQMPAPTPEPTVNADDNIKSDIKGKLESAGYKDVKVDVMNGEVILSGDLKRSDLTKVMQIANESNPRKVTNNLKLK